MSTHKLRDHLPHLTWDDLKNELLRQYSAIPFDSYEIQASACLQQGPDELLEISLHCTSEVLSNIHHMTDMSVIIAEGLQHSTMVYGLNLNKLQD